VGARCSLSGTIPSGLGSLPLFDLYLDNNSLSGTIPSEILGVQTLVQVNLARNHLEGTISPSLGRAHSLTHLFLSDNPLVGFVSLEPCSSQEARIKLLTLDPSSSTIRTLLSLAGAASFQLRLEIAAPYNSSRYATQQHHATTLSCTRGPGIIQTMMLDGLVDF